MGKRNDFIKKLTAGVLVSGVAISGLVKSGEAYNDLSKHTTENDKYVDYIKGSEIEKRERLAVLDENISKYEELESKILLNEDEKEELNELTSFLENEMSSGELGRFYLNDVYKEKIKQAYNVKDVKTHYDKDGIIIQLCDEKGKWTAMEEKDIVRPLEVALRDIVRLQDLREQDEFTKSDIKTFIEAQKNMKGFSNLHFIKAEGEPLKWAEIGEIDKGEER